MATRKQIQEEKRWREARKKAIQEAIRCSEKALKHYKHLLKGEEHNLKDCFGKNAKKL